MGPCALQVLCSYPFNQTDLVVGVVALRYSDPMKPYALHIEVEPRPDATCLSPSLDFATQIPLRVIRYAG